MFNESFPVYASEEMSRLLLKLLLSATITALIILSATFHLKSRSIKTTSIQTLPASISFFNHRGCIQLAAVAIQRM